MGQAGTVTTSRVRYAYARDGCFGPIPKLIKVGDQTTKTPVRAVSFNTSIGMGCLLLIFGGPVAINAIFSITAIAVIVALAVPILMRVILKKSSF
ncbi:hypothetical protein CROQUDRAFT_110111 [Cronartium quercuum f. sp. fusiforme G11]|uniref:Uncharacterized protein n=1 Tax=Cronartium quercuum f. sp. fusiforme G11 TaxID=708437 RepID=A0A9P6T7K7_9BASI|nr:hypothetical protein CROQUDRAFT_110111 [Cronartium quercuum f. sp. fusiforme G11]